MPIPRTSHRKYFLPRGVHSPRAIAGRVLGHAHRTTVRTVAQQLTAHREALDGPMDAATLTAVVHAIPPGAIRLSPAWEQKLAAMRERARAQLTGARLSGYDEIDTELTTLFAGDTARRLLSSAAVVQGLIAPAGQDAELRTRHAEALLVRVVTFEESLRRGVALQRLVGDDIHLTELITDADVHRWLAARPKRENPNAERDHMREIALTEVLNLRT